MISEIAKEFENITKFSLLEYFVRYNEWMKNDYSDVYNYYAGNTESIDAAKITTLTKLIDSSNDLMRTFQTFSGKLGNVGYWELQRYCQDLKDTLERIAKFPKYLRTAKTTRGYKPYVQIAGEIGGMKTVQDLADQIGRGITEQELIINNDLQEKDYEIDQLKEIRAMVNNKNSVVVTTILEQPVGRKIYGKDINRKIRFVNDENGRGDLSVVKYEDNVEQKCNVLLELNKGDVPEIPNFGKEVMIGGGMEKYNYAALMVDLRRNFEQDDLFDNIEVVDIKPDRTTGNVFISVEIQTKYVYSTTQTIQL